MISSTNSFASTDVEAVVRKVTSMKIRLSRVVIISVIGTMGPAGPILRYSISPACSIQLPVRLTLDKPATNGAPRRKKVAFARGERDRRQHQSVGANKSVPGTAFIRHV